jgi:ubiquinone/menaquinone biosynthesis C-methylase UbiE
METQEQLKELVRQKYAEIASQDKDTSEGSCCGSGCCNTEVNNIMADDYTQLEGYNPDADLGLGCGLPTQFAKIKKGDVVIDLGSGAGNDAFIARHETGETGKVIGIDFTPAMIERARLNNEVRGFNNVEFRQGDMEEMPVASNTADVIVSNCVLNLVPNKDGVFKEIFRVLKPGGHFSISDVVLVGNLPESLRADAEMYAGCVSGAIQKEVYLELIHSNGFANITVQKEKKIIVRDEILKKYLNDEQVSQFKFGNVGIFSITVYAEKPKDEMKITILDPAMCCSTGVCGVDVDEELVLTAANVKWLKSLGYHVQRHNISNDAAAFKNFPAAIDKLRKEGADSLPYIFINDKLVMQGNYPKRSDWESWIKTDNNDQHVKEETKILAKKENSSTGSCCSGSGCC